MDLSQQKQQTTARPTVQANLQREDMAPNERRALMNFWFERYEKSPDMRVRDGYTNYPGRSAGGQGLFIAHRQPHAQAQIDPNDPTHPVNKAFEQRQAELRNEGYAAPRQDKERLGLLSKVEASAHEYWRCKTLADESNGPDKRWLMRQAKSHAKDTRLGMEDLMTYDRQNNHPVSEPRRDLEKNPVSVHEQYAWLQRDNRSLDGHERTSLMMHGVDTIRPTQAEIAPRTHARQPWYVDNRTQGMVNARLGVQAEVERREQAREVPGVPAQSQSSQSKVQIAQAPKDEQALAKAREQISYIQSPIQTPYTQPRQVVAESLREASRVDPSFAQTMTQAHQEGRGGQAIAEHMAQVQKRYESVQSKVDNGDQKVLPLRSSDVILLRGQHESQQVAQGVRPTAPMQSAKEPAPVEPEKAIAQGQSQGMSKENLVPFAEALAKRRSQQMAPAMEQRQDQERPKLDVFSKPNEQGQRKPDVPSREQVNASFQGLANAEARQTKLKTQLEELGKTNQALTRVRDRLAADNQDRQGAAQTLDRIQARRAPTPEAPQGRAVEMDDSVRNAKRAYQDQIQQRAPQPAQPKAQRPSRSAPEPGGFDQWWSGVKQRVSDYKDRAVGFARGVMGQETQPVRRAQTPQERGAEIKAMIAARPVNPNKAREQRPQDRTQGRETTQTKNRQEPKTPEQRASEIRAMVASRPAGPGTVRPSQPGPSRERSRDAGMGL